jgi:hypothetical protein
MKSRPEAARRRTALRAALVLCAAFFPGGCSAAAWRDRMHDLAQIVDVSFTMGPGLGASVRVTELAQVGFGDFDGRSVGLVEGRFAAAREQQSELGVSLLHTYAVRRESDQLLAIRHPYFGDPGFEEHPLSWQMESDRQATDVGLGFHFFIFGVNVALHPSELLDFMAGCCGFDPQKDDAWSRSIEDLRKQARSLDATTRRRAFDALKRRGEDLHGYAIYTARESRPSFQRRAMEAIDPRSATPPAPAQGTESH